MEDKRAYLCKYLNPCDHFDYLRSKKVLTRDDQEVIKNEPSQSTKAGKMLDILQTKGPEGYEALVLSIQKNKTQTFLVTMLNTEFESRKNAYMCEYDLCVLLDFFYHLRMSTATCACDRK